MQPREVLELIIAEIHQLHASAKRIEVYNHLLGNQHITIAEIGIREYTVEMHELCRYLRVKLDEDEDQCENPYEWRDTTNCQE